MRKWLLLLIFLVPIAYAIEECQRVTVPKDIPCQIVSSWKNGNCSNYNITFYNQSGGAIYSTNWGDYPPFCNVSFNISESGIYPYNSSPALETGIINVEAEDNMTSLGVIIFLLLLNIVLFIAPFRVMFVKNIVMNEVIKKVMWTLALVILAFNTTILASLAENAGLGITHEIFVFQWFFLKALYICMIWIVWSMFVSIPKLIKQQRTQKRMGEHEE